MRTDWKEIKLGEVAKVISGFAFKSKDFTKDKGVPAIKIKNIKNGNIDLDETDFVDESFLTINARYHLNRNDILVSLTGSHMTQPNSVVGRVALYRHDFTSLLNQRAGKVLPNESEIDRQFLYCFLSQDNIKETIAMKANGAANQANVSPGDVEDLVILLPPLATQQKIASILSAYDDLIENNLRRIKLLEEMAAITYKEWFVNFTIDGQKLEIDAETGLPFGWDVRRADSIYDIKIGKTPPREQTEWFTENGIGIKWASIKDMNNSLVFIQSTSERITEEGIKKFNMNVAKKDTVILSFKLTVGKVSITTESFVTNEAIAHFNIIDEIRISKEFTYCYLKEFNYDSLGSTSAIGTALNSKVVKAMPILVPDDKVLKSFNGLISPILDKIENLTHQNRLLKEARDILLPRLMSGEIPV